MNAYERAQQWASDPFFDLGTRAEAARALKDERELAAAFGDELRFGTGGLRGVMGAGTARVNAYTVGRATLGLARYLKSRAKKPEVAIAYDSRRGSDALAKLTASVLAAEGVRAHVFPTLAPTPMLSFAVRALHADAGVMITASHNPAEYNGYKVYGADGCQITDRAAAEITAFIGKAGYADFARMAEGEARRARLWLDVGDDVRRGFLQAALLCRPDPDASAPIRVTYTPLNGAGLLPVREALSHMQNVTLLEVEAQRDPDGDFPTCPKPNPELDEALAVGIREAALHQADLLLATDPDCDRVGVAARAPDGAFRRLSGNEVGLLLCEYILSTRRAQGTLKRGSVVVKTIVTSDLAFPIAKRYGADVREVLTGFKYIGEAIGEMERAGREGRFVFGFEESCGYLAGTHVRDKDGVMACVLVCEMAQALASRGLTLWDAVRRLYATYGAMADELVSVDVAGAAPMREMMGRMARLREHPPAELGGAPVTAVKDYLPGLDGLPPSDVLSFAASGGLKAVVRPSGTEPKIKAYLSATADGMDEARAAVARVKRDVLGWLA